MALSFQLRSQQILKAYFERLSQDVQNTKVPDTWAWLNAYMAQVEMHYPMFELDKYELKLLKDAMNDWLARIENNGYAHCEFLCNIIEAYPASASVAIHAEFKRTTPRWFRFLFKNPVVAAADIGRNLRKKINEHLQMYDHPDYVSASVFEAATLTRYFYFKIKGRAKRINNHELMDIVRDYRKNGGIDRYTETLMMLVVRARWVDKLIEFNTGKL